MAPSDGLNELTAAQVCARQKQAKLESAKTLSDRESPRYGASEKVFHFNEITTHKKHPINFKCLSFLNQ